MKKNYKLNRYISETIVSNQKPPYIGMIDLEMSNILCKQ